MPISILTILVDLNRLETKIEKIRSNESSTSLTNQLDSLAENFLNEWTEFQLLEAPQPAQPPGAAPPGKTVDPKTVTTINKLKSVTKNLRIVPNVAASGIAKQAAGQAPNTAEIKQMAMLDTTIGQAAKTAILDPRQGAQTINAIQQAARSAQKLQQQRGRR